eukprot:m.259847 g.259847  ORF g.259847 m.259847 type:complete len:67 (-) comp17589_c0_seq10:5662-5862(-)
MQLNTKRKPSNKRTPTLLFSAHLLTIVSIRALNLLNSGTPLDSFDNTTYKFRKYCQYTLAFQDASF